MDRCGFIGRPSWEELQAGARPPVVDSAEPGDWLHGWQHHASSSSEYHHRETMVSQSSDADQAHLRSHSGPGSSSLSHGTPVQPVLFRTLLLERMMLPIQVTESRCECGSPLDKVGRHRGACPRSGRLRSRALPTERTMARVCREAGAIVRCNCRLHDMNVAVDHRPACHRGGGVWPSFAPWSPTRCGHHSPIRTLCSRPPFWKCSTR